jgi:Mg-chelatase subunit ChlD
MRYVDGSAEPEPKSVAALGGLVEWQVNNVPTSGITFTLEVEPLEAGFWPTNAQATGTFIDNKDREGQVGFNVPWVTVLKAEPYPTPTAPPELPTATPTATASATPSPTPTDPPEPPPEPEPVYLPIAVVHPCQDVELYADVVLVMDVSTSMNWPTRDSRPKLAASVEAAKLFAAQMRFVPDATGECDRMAVVGFNRRAWLEQPLTNDEAAVIRALDRLSDRQAEFTRLDLAIATGTDALLSADPRPANTRVLVLLTDGLPNQVPYADDGTMATTVKMHADSAKAEGIRIYTIGVGDPGHIDESLLKAVASDPYMYFHEPDAEDLRRAYDEIAGTLRCPRSRSGWPGPWPLYP